MKFFNTITILLFVHFFYCQSPNKNNIDESKPQYWKSNPDNDLDKDSDYFVTTSRGRASHKAIEKQSEAMKRVTCEESALFSSRYENDFYYLLAKEYTSWSFAVGCIIHTVGNNKFDISHGRRAKFISFLKTNFPLKLKCQPSPVQEKKDEWNECDCKVYSKIDKKKIEKFLTQFYWEDNLLNSKENSKKKYYGSFYGKIESFEDELLESNSKKNLCIKKALEDNKRLFIENGLSSEFLACGSFPPYGYSSRFGENCLYFIDISGYYFIDKLKTYNFENFLKKNYTPKVENCIAIDTKNQWDECQCTVSAEIHVDKVKKELDRLKGKFHDLSP